MLQFRHSDLIWGPLPLKARVSTLKQYPNHPAGGIKNTFRRARDLTHAIGYSILAPPRKPGTLNPTLDTFLTSMKWKSSGGFRSMRI